MLCCARESLPCPPAATSKLGPQPAPTLASTEPCGFRVLLFKAAPGVVLAAPGDLEHMRAEACLSEKTRVPKPYTKVLRIELCTGILSTKLPTVSRLVSITLCTSNWPGLEMDLIWLER